MKPLNLRSRPAGKALLCALVPVAAAIAATPAQAFNFYLNSWQATYPTSLADDNAAASGSPCVLCHVQGNYSQFNGYGWSLKQSGVDFAGVEALNSDGDPTGASNLEEINADAQPGWTPGPNNPINGGDITNTALPPGGIAGPLDPMAINQPPTADPNGPYNGTEGVQIGFDGTGSTDPDGIIVAYDWNFGDGNTGTGPAPSHTYLSTGIFNVTLTVTDDAGDTDTATTTATIGAGNQPPIADPNGPYVGTVGIPVALDGSGSADPDGTLVAYDWDFGDGSLGSGVSPSHAYAVQGTYNITLTVTDDNGAIDSATTSATIDPANQAPTADPNGPYNGTVNVLLAFDGTSSTDTDGTIASYEWDFGDGNTGTGSTPAHIYIAEGIYNVTLTVTDDGGLTNTAVTTATIGAPVNLPPVANPNGPYAGTVGLPVAFDSTGSDDPDGTLVAYDWDFGDGMIGIGPNPSHTYLVQGTYNVSLTVTDDNGAMDSNVTTVTIGLGNQAPIADANGPYNGTVGIPVQLDGSGSSDPDGTITSHEWDFGDGSTGTGQNPTHTYAAAGTYNITLTVMDDDGAMDSSATTAMIAEPTAGADVYLTELWAPDSIRVKAGKIKSKKIIALGGGTGIPQGATVNLNATVPPTGVDVVVKDPSETEEIVPGEDPEQFEFEVKIACLEVGTHTVEWSTTINADQNNDPTNDTMAGATSVHCVGRPNVSKPNKHEKEDDKEEKDHMEEEEGDDD